MNALAPSLAQFHPVTGDGEPVMLRAANFPARIGRGADCAVRVTDEGVWEHHLELHLDSQMRFTLRTASDATAMVNGEPLVGVHRLGNGDIIELGAAKLQFLLGNVNQKGLELREAALWLLLAAILAGQIGLVLWLG